MPGREGEMVNGKKHQLISVTEKAERQKGALLEMAVLAELAAIPSMYASIGFAWPVRRV
jgi:hypothetical protein